MIEEREKPGGIQTYGILKISLVLQPLPIMFISLLRNTSCFDMVDPYHKNSMVYSTATISSGPFNTLFYEANEVSFNLLTIGGLLLLCQNILTVGNFFCPHIGKHDLIEFGTDSDLGAGI